MHKPTLSQESVDAARGRYYEVPVQPHLELLVLNFPPWLPFFAPLGPVSVAGYLRKEGFNVQMIDLNADLFWNFADHWAWWQMESTFRWQAEDTFDAMFALFRPYLEKRCREIIAADPLMIGLSAVGSKERFIRHFSAMLLGLGWSKQLIFGGPACSNYEGRMSFSPLLKDIYAFVVGEGELPALELMKAQRLRQKPRAIPGVVYPEDDHPG